jgi:hypothetical protein
VKYLKDWKRILSRVRGPATASRLAAEMENRFHALLPTYAHITAKPLPAKLENLILPGLVLYQILLADMDGDRLAALAEADRFFYAEFFTFERRFLTLLRVLPDPLPILRPALRQMCRNTYLPGATEVVEDSQDCFAVNTYQCFILDTLTCAGAPELTPLYCKTDEWLAALLPHVCWLRTGKLALGADCCDFRWSRRG